MKRRAYILPMAAVVAILYTLWHQWTSDQAHHDFFEDMRGFIQAGPRFTAQDGHALCMALNQVALHQADHHEEPVVLLECDKLLENRETPRLPPAP